MTTTNSRPAVGVNAAPEIRFVPDEGVIVCEVVPFLGAAKTARFSHTTIANPLPCYAAIGVNAIVIDVSVRVFVDTHACAPPVIAADARNVPAVTSV